MPKLYFRYGAMNSAKTLNLLAVAHNYHEQNKEIKLLKPELDTRSTTINSRAGLEKDVDILLKTKYEWNDEWVLGSKCLLVDEAQFLSKQYIDTFRHVVDNLGIPVICYGLRTDFQTNLFEGSKRLMEVADTIEEIKNTCFNDGCNKKAVFNMRVVAGNAVNNGPVILIGDTYHGMCSLCYYRDIKR